MPDEDVAAELERSAARAQARGGFAAAAAFLERSSVLTPDPRTSRARALAAAQTKYQAGALDEALALARTPRRARSTSSSARRSDLLRARIAFAADRGSDAPRLLLAAADGLEPLDADAGARDLPRGAVRRPVRRSSGGGVRRSRRSRPRHAPRRPTSDAAPRRICCSTGWRG